MSPDTPAQNQSAPNGLFDFGDFKHARTQLLAAFRAEPAYHLLLGESGAGKTALVRDLQSRLNRNTRLLYVSANANLSPAGLARTLARHLQLAPRRGQADNTHQILHALLQDPRHTLLVLDDAHFLPDQTLLELHPLAEAHLQTHPLLSLLLAGLPPLHDRLQRPALFPLQRRLHLRLQINGLTRNEILPFLKHHLSEKQAHRFTPQALDLLFERARGLPALLQRFTRLALSHSPEDPLEPQQLLQILDRWELP